MYKNGSSEYSRIVSIDVSQPGIQIANVYPSPFWNSLNVQFTLLGPAKVTLVLSDLQGRRLRTIEYKGAAGNNKVIIPDLGQLAGGMYILTLQSGGGSQSIRVLKSAN